ncbi:hypothetical protein FD19_GL000564 [Lacticaseibacillus thailandensis DSM 22698 = JCM 13996]|uniref:HTH merR-type domain-containing protein n=2 Tax=Lacticaseibacillus thailandensis TaxID=381741 RepID=A0A0R2CA69_9LACO|nr:hypothetical protein FD19_GL000564 [Lacticaseibacillus thailandensis DSM 22698 = JCM 13996]
MVMANSEILRRRAVLPIGTVMDLTTLTARQIRYYETQGFVHPARNAGNHRMFSLADVDVLLSIVQQRKSGLSLSEIRRMRAVKARQTTDTDARKMLQDDILNQSGFTQTGRGPFGQGFN